MTSEELIKRIQESIKALQEQQAALKAGSQAMDASNRQLTYLVNALAVLNAGLGANAQQFNKATVDVKKYFQAIDEGRKRVQTGGQRFRLGITGEPLINTGARLQFDAMAAENARIMGGAGKKPDTGGVEAPDVKVATGKAKTEEEIRAEEKAWIAAKKKYAVSLRRAQRRLDAKLKAVDEWLHSNDALLEATDTGLYGRLSGIVTEPTQTSGPQASRSVRRQNNTLLDKIKAPGSAVPWPSVIAQERLGVDQQMDQAAAIRAAEAKRRAYEEVLRNEQEAERLANEIADIRVRQREKLDATNRYYSVARGTLGAIPDAQKRTDHPGDVIYDFRTTSRVEEEELAWQRQQELQRQAEQKRRMEARERERLNEWARQTRERYQSNINMGEHIFGGQQAAQNVYARARAIDPMFTPETVKDINTDPSSKISRIKFEYRDMENVIRRTTFTVNRFGDVLIDTQKRFRTFGDAIARDIVEVAKWSIAVAVVYAPMQKLGELMTDMVKIQSELADVTIAIGNAQADVSKIFDAAYKIAQQTGEGITGVIDAYKSAYQATGSIADQNERAAATEKLLADSILLSKLTILSQAESIDTLAAALRQTFGSDGLGRGEELLNKWIRVSRIANVDMNTLATTFATVGEQADTAGIDVDKLNAIVASIAETSDSSAKEVANATKALLSSFQTDQTRAELDKLGIAWKTASGDARNFIDIAEDVQRARKAQLITETQFSQLTLMQGGGARRQPVVAAFYGALDKIPTIQAESARATAKSGEAEQALGMQMETVKTATERLNNAFLSLANTLGSEGGLLSYFKGLVDIGTVLVSIFDRLFSVMGKGGPALAATLGVLAYLNRPGRMKDVKGIVGDLAYNTTAGFINNSSTLTSRLSEQQKTNATVGAYNFAQQNTGKLLAGAGIATMAIANATQGNWEAAAGNAIGGAIGLALGGPVGGMVGATIAESFVRTVQAYKPEFQNLFTPPVKPPVTPGKEDVKKLTPQELRKQASDEAMRALGGGNYAMGQVRGAFGNAYYNASGWLGNLFSKNGGQWQGYTQDQTLLMALKEASTVQAGGAVLGRDTRIEAAAGYAKVMEMLQRANALENANTPQMQAIKAQTSSEATTIARQFANELKNKLISGDIGTAAFKRGTEQLSGFSSFSASKLAAFGNMFGSQTDTLEAFARISAYANPETITEINTLAQQAISLQEVLDALPKSANNYKSVQEELNLVLAQATNLVKEQNTAILAQAKLYRMTDLSQYDSGEVQTILAKAQQRTKENLQLQVYQGVITPDEMQAKLDALEPLLIKLGATTSQTVRQIAIEDINAVIQELEKAGEIASKEVNIGWSSMKDITKAQYEQAMQKYPAMKATLEGMGVKTQEEDFVLVMKDGFMKDHRDQKIVQYLLQEILNVEQKQLDGMYNLPEGATFWIPYDAAKMMVGNPTTPTPGGDITAPGTTEEHKVIPKPYDTPTLAEYNAAKEIAKQVEISKINTYPETLKNTGEEADRYTTRTENQLGTENFDIMNFFKMLFGSIGTGLSPLLKTPEELMKVSGIGGLPPLDLSGLTQALSNLSTRLNLNMNLHTTVTLNGRVLGEILKQTLKDDLVRYSNNSATRTFTI